MRWERAGGREGRSFVTNQLHEVMIRIQYYDMYNTDKKLTKWMCL